MWPNPQETTDLVTFTEEILNGKLYFVCAVQIIFSSVSVTHDACNQTPWKGTWKQHLRFCDYQDVFSNSLSNLSGLGANKTKTYQD